MSLDGRIDHLHVDLGRYYSLANKLGADSVLAGSDTILTSLTAFPEPTPNDVLPKTDEEQPASPPPQEEFKKVLMFVPDRCVLIRVCVFVCVCDCACVV